MNIATCLLPIADRLGERPAVSVGVDLFCDYRTLARRVAGLAAGLRDGLGLRPGDRVGIAMKNAPEYIEILLACWHAGLCAVPFNAKLHQREFAYALDHCGARVAFVTEDLADIIGSIIGEARALERVIPVASQDYQRLVSADLIGLTAVGENDPAWIFYTSGTTGRPKGATLSHRNLWGMTWRYYADIDQVTPFDSYIHAAPMSHGSGLYGLPHLAQGSHQIIPDSRGFDAGEMLDLMARYRDITFFAAPTMLTRLTDHPHAANARVDSLKTIYYGGAPMYLEDLKRTLARFGPRLCQIFGQGESPMTGTGLTKAMHGDVTHPRYEARLASTGVARTGVEVRVVDGDDRDVPIGDAGEVLFRSDVMMLGYWNDAVATAAALRGGWLHTGDIGSFDADGFLTLKDRSKDMIISGGSNIYPREIEEVLLTDPRLEEVSVVGRQHADWGEEVVAFVVARAGETVAEAELDALCLANIARFKRPKAYVFVTSLPKSNYGKILKTELRKWLTSPGGASSPS